MKVRLKFDPALSGKIGRYHFRKSKFRDFRTKKKAYQIIEKILKEKPNQTIILSQIKTFGKEIEEYPLEIYKQEKGKIVKNSFFSL